MGIFDKVKNIAKKADDTADMAKEHADKLPGGMGDKVSEVAETVDGLTDKIPGVNDDAEAETEE